MFSLHTHSHKRKRKGTYTCLFMKHHLRSTRVWHSMCSQGISSFYLHTHSWAIPAFAFPTIAGNSFTEGWRAELAWVAGYVLFVSLPPTKKLCFCLRVFVCFLSVSRLTQKVADDCWWISCLTSNKPSDFYAEPHHDLDPRMFPNVG